MAPLRAVSTFIGSGATLRIEPEWVLLRGVCRSASPVRCSSPAGSLDPTPVCTCTTTHGAQVVHCCFQYVETQHLVVWSFVVTIVTHIDRFSTYPQVCGQAIRVYHAERKGAVSSEWNEGEHPQPIGSQTNCLRYFALAQHDMVGSVIHEEGGDTHDFSERAAAQNCF